MVNLGLEENYNILSKNISHFNQNIVNTNQISEDEFYAQQQEIYDKMKNNINNIKIPQQNIFNNTKIPSNLDIANFHDPNPVENNHTINNYNVNHMPINLPQNIIKNNLSNLNPNINSSIPLVQSKPIIPNKNVNNNFNISNQKNDADFNNNILNQIMSQDKENVNILNFFCPNFHNNLLWSGEMRECQECESFNYGFYCDIDSYFVCFKCVDYKIQKNCPHNHELKWVANKKCFNCSEYNFCMFCEKENYSVCYRCYNYDFKQTTCPNKHDFKYFNFKSCFLCKKKNKCLGCEKDDFYLCLCNISKDLNNNLNVNNSIQETISQSNLCSVFRFVSRFQFKKQYCILGHPMVWRRSQNVCFRCEETNQMGLFCEQCDTYSHCVDCYEFKYPIIDCPNNHGSKHYKWISEKKECLRCRKNHTGYCCIKCDYFICRRNCVNSIIKKYSGKDRQFFFNVNLKEELVLDRLDLNEAVFPDDDKNSFIDNSIRDFRIDDLNNSINSFNPRMLTKRPDSDNKRNLITKNSAGSANQETKLNNSLGNINATEAGKTYSIPTGNKIVTSNAQGRVIYENKNYIPSNSSQNQQTNLLPNYNSANIIASNENKTTTIVYNHNHHPMTIVGSANPNTHYITSAGNQKTTNINNNTGNTFNNNSVANTYANFNHSTTPANNLVSLTESKNAYFVSSGAPSSNITSTPATTFGVSNNLINNNINYHKLQEKTVNETSNTNNLTNNNTSIKPQLQSYQYVSNNSYVSQNLKMKVLDEKYIISTGKNEKLLLYNYLNGNLIKTINLDDPAITLHCDVKKILIDASCLVNQSLLVIFFSNGIVYVVDINNDKTKPECYNLLASNIHCILKISDTLFLIGLDSQVGFWEFRSYMVSRKFEVKQMIGKIFHLEKTGFSNDKNASVANVINNHIPYSLNDLNENISKQKIISCDEKSIKVWTFPDFKFIKEIDYPQANLFYNLNSSQKSLLSFDKIFQILKMTEEKLFIYNNTLNSITLVDLETGDIIIDSKTFEKKALTQANYISKKLFSIDSYGNLVSYYEGVATLWDLNKNTIASGKMEKLNDSQGFYTNYDSLYGKVFIKKIEEILLPNKNIVDIKTTSLNSFATLEADGKVTFYDFQK